MNVMIMDDGIEILIEMTALSAKSIEYRKFMLIHHQK